MNIFGVAAKISTNILHKFLDTFKYEKTSRIEIKKKRKKTHLFIGFFSCHFMF